ncbi:MAG: manganese-binding transcriptional regulator MntR [Acidobacteriota bacterium]
MSAGTEARRISTVLLRQRPRSLSSDTDRPTETQADAFRQTRRDHSLETAEDYVEAIADLMDRVGEARAVDLARRFGVSHVTVVRTVSRLQRDGYVSTQPYRSVFLTAKGARLARASRERHALVVDFLRALGISDHAAQADAEGIEHHVSTETLAAFSRHIASARRRRAPEPAVKEPRR